MSAREAPYNRCVPSEARIRGGAGDPDPAQPSRPAGSDSAHAWGSLDRERRLAAIAALALFVTMFLPWYQQNAVVTAAKSQPLVSRNLNAFAVFSFVEAAVLLVAVAVLVLLYVRAEGRRFQLPGGDGAVVLAAGAVERAAADPAAVRQARDHPARRRRQRRHPVGDLLRARRRRSARLRGLADARRAAARDRPLTRRPSDRARMPPRATAQTRYRRRADRSRRPAPPSEAALRLSEDRRAGLSSSRFEDPPVRATSSRSVERPQPTYHCDDDAPRLVPQHPTSAAEVAEGLRAVGYLPGESTALVAYLATRLGKPVLVEGPAGVGKTELAKALARYLGRELVRLQCYEGLDEAKALYEWNYRKQLLRIQAEARRRRLERGAGGHLRRGVPARAAADDARSRAEEPVVLLIDEIDKTDQEFEAMLLEVLSDFQISIPELGRVESRTHPVVLLTSNNSRELTEALKRRCLYLWLDYPGARARARDRAPARAGAARDGRAQAGRGDRDGARARPQEAAVDRRVDRLGARAAAARRAGHRRRRPSRRRCR